ncbi:MAG: hypothetical protein ACLTSZ_05065 [Lachnospiraceae bacterium]
MPEKALMSGKSSCVRKYFDAGKSSCVRKYFDAGKSFCVRKYFDTGKDSGAGKTAVPENNVQAQALARDIARRKKKRQTAGCPDGAVFR